LLYFNDEDDADDVDCFVPLVNGTS